METKNEKFKRLAEKRVNNVIKQLELIGNLSNSSAYDFEEKDIEKIFKAIKIEVKKAELQFDKKEPFKNKFNL